MNGADRRFRSLSTAAFVGWAAGVVATYMGGWGARAEPLVAQGGRLLLLAGVLMSAWAAGCALPRLGRPDDDLPARPVLRLAFGLTLLSFLWLALGAAGLLEPTIAWATLGVGAVAGAVALVRRPLPSSPLHRGLPAEALLPAAIVCVGALIALPMALAPPASTDELVYHLTIPKWNIAAGRLQAYPDFAHAAFPSQIEMLYTWVLLLGQAVVAKLLHFSMGVCAVVLAAAVARREGENEAGWFTAALLLSTPVLLLNMSLAWVDAATALFVLAGSVLLVRLRERPTLHHVLVAGIFWGMALGTKYTALLYLALGVLTCLWPDREERERASTLVRRAVLVGSLAVVLASPWFVRNTVVYGNPTHPLGAGVWASDLEGSHALLTTLRGTRESLADRLQGLAFYTFGNRAADSTLGFLWLLAVPVVLLRRPRGPSYRLALAGVTASALLSAGFAGSVRFQIPALFLIAPAAGTWLAAWWREGGVRRAAAGGLLAVAACSNLSILAWHDRELFDPVRVALGFEQQDSYLSRMETNYRVLQHLNREEPATSRVLAISVERLFYLDRPVVTGGPLDVSPAREMLRRAGNAEAFAERLRRQGITHVLFDRAAFGRDVRVSLQAGAWRPEEIAVLDEFFARVAETVVRHKSVELYRVPARRPPPSRGTDQ